MTTTIHRRPSGVAAMLTVGLALAATMTLRPSAASASLTVVAAYEMNEMTTGGDRTMVDAGPFDLDGTIGDSITTMSFGGSRQGYRWNYTPPDTGPKDDERLGVVETAEELNPGAADFAIEVRYRTTHASGNIVQKGQSSTDGGYWKLDQSDGFPSCMFRRNGSDHAYLVAPVRANDGAWHTIRCERRGAYARMLVDGVQVDRKNRSVGTIANSFPMTIGGKLSCNQKSVGCDYFTGDVDWVRIEKDVPSIPNDPPTMHIAAPGCELLTCTFDSSASFDPDGQIVDRQWDFGDGSLVDHQDTVARHSFASAGTYTVSLVGSDDDGASSQPAVVEVTVTGPANEPPAMTFTADCDGRSCRFDSSASHDSDGSILSREWSFGDGNGTVTAAAVVSHTFATDGAFTVRLVGTDDGGAVDTVTLTLAIDPDPDEGSMFVPLPPTRVFDTRHDEPAPGPKGVVRGGSSIDVDVTGVAGVPKTGVTAVAINLTAIGLDAPSYVAARPAGAPEAITSSLNLVTPGEVRANMAIVPVGAGGAITLTSLRDAHLLGDIAGYFTGSVATSDAGRIVTQQPQRLFDTRPGTDLGPKGRVPAGGTIRVPVLGRAGVPTDGVAAVIVNVTATAAGDAGFVTVWPSLTARPLASTMNLNRAGESVANQVIVPVGADGAIELFSLSSVDLVADVSGYVTDSDAPVTTTGLFVPLDPARVFDTRPGEVGPGPKGLVPAGGTIRARVAGVGGVPESADGVVLNVTLIGTGPGYASLWPTGADRPATSNVNVVTGGDVRPNSAIVQVGTGGRIDAYVLTPGHLLADVSGYLLA